MKWWKITNQDPTIKREMDGMIHASRGMRWFLGAPSKTSPAKRKMIKKSRRANRSK